MPKLPFTIALCDGEDPDYPASSLEHKVEAGVSGWQSPRFIEYPLELGLEFSDLCKIEQLQLLSHQSKICSKIEIAVGNGDTYSSAEFKYLGSMSLDNNERSGYRARELKSVYLDCAGKYLRLTLHQCFINKYNLYNQIGIVAINALGVPLHDDSRGSGENTPKEVMPSLMQSLSGSSASSAAGIARMQTAKAQKEVSKEYDDLAFDLAFDRVTAEKIRSIVEAKAACVAAEDFQGAKALKQAEQQLKAIGVQLAKMESQKTTAVAREDYDAARSLRDQIKKLRDGVDKQLLDIPAYRPFSMPAGAEAK